MYGIGNAKGDNKIMLKKQYSCDDKFWFLAPECAQLAACTFNRPVCVYYAAAAFTYLPIFPSKSRPKTALLYMHIVQTSLGTKPDHWITLKFKKSIKNTLPMIDTEKSKAFSALGKPSDDLFWKKCHLTFC